MNYFLKSNKNILSYSLILLLFIPIFGLKLIVGLLGNILLLLFLIPLLLLLVAFLIFNSYKSKINTCSNCGVISFNLGNTCMNCGFEQTDKNKKDSLAKQPSESTIDVNAVEIE